MTSFDLLKSTILLLVLAAALSLVASAQTELGRIAGTVTDINGAVIKGASLNVKNQSTGESRSIVVSDDGTFSITNLRPSKYTVDAHAANFEPVSATDIEILAGQGNPLLAGKLQSGGEIHRQIRRTVGKRHPFLDAGPGI